MQVRDILPIIVPGILIQLLIQARYIHHCWHNNSLGIRKKILYIVVIALFNIPAAGVYLLMTRKRAADLREESGDETDSAFRQGVFILLISSFEIFTLRMFFENLENPQYPLIIGLLSVCFVLMIIHGILLSARHKPWFYLLPALQIPIVLTAMLFDTSSNGIFIVLAVLAGLINGLPLKPARLYAVTTFGLFLAANFIQIAVLHQGVYSDERVSLIYVNTLVFLLVFAAFYSLKKQTIANLRLERALHTLKQQSVQLEEMGALAERNRITGEIHDTVGHTLTGAVISIEAGEKLLEGNRDAALLKFALAKEQVRQGLENIRSSVRMIRSREKGGFIEELSALIESIRKNTGLTITFEGSLETGLLSIQQNELLRAVTECATNSLKHGKSTEADLLLQEHRGKVCMTFSDNGEGVDCIQLGFGLSEMKRRVESLGGSLTVRSARGEGFTVTITLPAGDEGGR